MAWIARDKDSNDCWITQVKPQRITDSVGVNDYWKFSSKSKPFARDFIRIPVDIVENIFGIKITWEDEPIKIILKEE